MKTGSAVASRPQTASLVPASFTPENAQEAEELVKRTLGIKDLTQELARLALKLNEESQLMTVDSEADQQAAEMMRGKYAAGLSRVIAAKEQYSKPWYRFFKLVNGCFSLTEDSFGQGKNRMSGLMAGWQRAKEDRARQERDRLQAIQNEKLRKESLKAKSKGLPPPPKKPDVEVSVPRHVGTSTFVKTWNYRITDEDKIPRAYLTPDFAKIKKMVTGGARDQDIPGVEIYQETGVRGG
ncbi:hypothetical protein LCGC14_0441470 [marine sediment metagenome]|uniref:Uncharacterized protein n=1 Tax=marine sediment metagenome TaxID=412755 RepID=A0A0F9SKB0_9ZZZZ